MDFSERMAWLDLGRASSALAENAGTPFAMLLRLGFAFLLGAFIAYRPWRRFLGFASPLREMVHAQILIAVAGALVVTVVGDSLARAFGLVGLGGFIRFRTGIRDPRDAAVFFLLIALGMACGIGSLGTAAVCAAFVALVVMALDLYGRGKERPYLRLTASCTDPLGAAGAARVAIESFPVTIRNTNLKMDEKEIRFDLENPKGVEPGKLQEAILSRTNGLVTKLECESLDTLKGSNL